MADKSKAAGFRTEVAQAFSDLKTLINELEPDVEKFTIKENNAAGTRLRKGAQTGKDLLQTIRLKTQEAKNAE